MTFVALTAKQEDGRNIQAVVYLPLASIERIDSLGAGSRLKLEERKDGVKTVAKVYVVYENGREIQASEDPNNTHPTINGIVDMALSPVGSVQGGGAVVAPYLTEIAGASVTPATTDAVDLPAATVDEVRVVYNPVDSGGAIDIFPDTGETIDGQAVNLPISVAAGGKITLVCNVAGAWVSIAG